MAYLTTNEFKLFGYSPPADGVFENAESSAEIMINSITSFYDPALGKNDLDSDLSSATNFLVQRAKAFKKAVAMQTQFVIDSGSSSAYEQQQNNLASYSVGNTSMSFKNGAMDNLTYGSSGVLKSVRLLLGKYGLLYSGVDHT